MIVLAITVGPDEATERLKAWAALVGVVWPQGLTATRVLIAGAVALVAIYGFIFRKQLKETPKRLTAAYRAFRAFPAAHQKPAPAEPAPKPEPKLLSLQESESKQAALILWRKVGSSATGLPAWLFDDIMPEVCRTTGLGMLLRHPVEHLRNAREKVDSALHDHSQVSLEETTNRLAVVFRLYIVVVRYMHECADAHGVQLVSEPYAERYARWQQLHEEFIARFQELSLRSDYADLRSSLSQEGATDTRFQKVS
jgi:hypothetical protein